MSMYNKFSNDVIHEAYSHPELAAFRRSFNISGRDHERNMLDCWYLQGSNTTEVFASISRDDYDKYVSAPVNRLSMDTTAARAFFLYQHLKDSGQLGKWRELRAARL